MGNEIRFDYVVSGLIGGFFCGGLAMFLWYRHRKDFFDYDDTEENNREK